MKQPDRHAGILRDLRSVQFRSVTDLARNYGVSEETIRRDLRQLEALGHVEKLHGGVMLRARERDTPFLQRMQIRLAAKTEIARKVATLIPEGATLFIDGGSTCCVAAQELVGRSDLTVVTYSSEVARTLAPGIGEVVLAPGRFDADDLCVYGADTVAYLVQHRCSHALVSASAVDAVDGFLDYKPREAELKRALVRAARQVIVAADAKKFGRAGFVQFASSEDVGILVTDRAPPVEIAKAMSRVEFVVCSG